MPIIEEEYRPTQDNRNFIRALRSVMENGKPILTQEEMNVIRREEKCIFPIVNRYTSWGDQSYESSRL